MDRNRICLLSFILLIVLAGVVSGSNDLKVFYLNTSHGDATLLESSGHFMMINAGDQQDFPVVKDYLKNTSVTMLDYAFASSLNESAIGGMADLMGEFPVSVYTDPSASFSSPSHDKVVKKIDSDQIGYQEAAPGASLPFGSATIQILNRSTSANNASENAISLTVTLGEVSFLFTGNQDLGPTPATIWEVPDQGRGGSFDSLSAISPKVLVISTGTGSLDKKTLETIKKQNLTPLMTNADGNIVITTDGNNYSAVTSNGRTLQKPGPVATPTPKPTQVLGNNTVSKGK